MNNQNKYIIDLHNLMVKLREATEEKDKDKIKPIVEQIKDLLDEFEEADFEDEDDFE